LDEFKALILASEKVNPAFNQISTTVAPKLTTLNIFFLFCTGYFWKTRKHKGIH